MQFFSQGVSEHTKHDISQVWPGLSLLFPSFWYTYTLLLAFHAQVCLAVRPVHELTTRAGHFRRPPILSAGRGLRSGGTSRKDPVHRCRMGRSARVSSHPCGFSYPIAGASITISFSAASWLRTLSRPAVGNRLVFSGRQPASRRRNNRSARCIVCSSSEEAACKSPWEWAAGGWYGPV